jgi:uncharacterized membrane protein YccF (DUF307 family)
MSYGPQHPPPASSPAAVTVRPPKTPILVRIIWFLFIGWWLSGIVITVGYLLCLFVVTLPLGIYLLHRVPLAQTLRDRSTSFETREVGGRVVLVSSHAPQRAFAIRAVWFVLVGWWFSAVWLSMAWLVSLTIIGLPLSIWMIDRVPEVLTLQRN